MPVMALIAAVTLAASTTAGPPVSEGEGWFWAWDDGSRARVRTLEVGGHLMRIPAVVVTVRPASQGRRVVLQTLHRGRWHTEDVAITGRTGAARLALNPFCADGDWCDGESAYRLLAGGRTASLTVRFDATDAS